MVGTSASCARSSTRTSADRAGLRATFRRRAKTRQPITAWVRVIDAAPGIGMEVFLARRAYTGPPFMRGSIARTVRVEVAGTAVSSSLYN